MTAEVADAAVERACQAIYREFDGYWPSDLERARIRVALASTIEVDWQAENERLRAALERLLTIGNESWKTPGHPMNNWVSKDQVNSIARQALRANE